MRRINRGHDRREQLRASALQRKEERAQRSAGQQLEVLDNRLGEGDGAIKERRRLQHLIENPPPPKKEKSGAGR